MLAEATSRIVQELQTTIHEIRYFTDSTVVLGYILNETRAFHTYVANRVQRIRNVSAPQQWYHVVSTENFADIASRGCSIDGLLASNWFKGPQHPDAYLNAGADHSEILPNDPEVRVVSVRKTLVSSAPLGHRLEKFSTWKRARGGLARLIAKIQAYRQGEAIGKTSPGHLTKAEAVMIREAQQPYRKSLGKPADRRISNLDPFLDHDGLIRVGGRLLRADIPLVEKHPLVLPKKSHVTMLIIDHFHQLCQHQGRHITAATIRTAGYWVQHGSKTIAGILHRCVVCRRLRGPFVQQKMADLPVERGAPSPPYTHVACDVFGHWEVETRRTRGGAANSKRWALLLTCLYSRAVHIEVLEQMTSDSLLCALRRFISSRGPILTLTSDQGKNMVGASNQLANIAEANEAFENFAKNNAFQWNFNPPHASNFGGVFERQIRSIRSVIDGILSTTKVTLTHEILTTFLCEAASIVNSRPLSDNPNDPNSPPLTPASLVTMKKKPLTSPDYTLVKQDAYAKNWWRRAQYLAEQFWARWKLEYLQSLQERSKWQQPTRNLRAGDVVIMQDETATRRYDWPIAMVSESYPSKDTLVRKVRIRFSDGRTLERPASKLVLLLLNTEAETTPSHSEVLPNEPPHASDLNPQADHFRPAHSSPARSAVI